jgi:hypothetical protein
MKFIEIYFKDEESSSDEEIEKEFVRHSKIETIFQIFLNFRVKFKQTIISFKNLKRCGTSKKLNSIRL